MYTWYMCTYICVHVYVHKCTCVPSGAYEPSKAARSVQLCIIAQNGVCIYSTLAAELGHTNTAEVLLREGVDVFARQELNAGEEKRREKAWKNLSRDPRHRHHNVLSKIGMALVAY